MDIFIAVFLVLCGLAALIAVLIAIFLGFLWFRGVPRLTRNIIKGNVLAIRGKHEKALEVYDGVLQEDPRAVQALIGKSEVFMKLRRCDEALSACERVLEIDRQSSEGWLGKGEALLEFSRHDEALAALNEGLRYVDKVT